MRNVAAPLFDIVEPDDPGEFDKHAPRPDPRELADKPWRRAGKPQERNHRREQRSP